MRIPSVSVLLLGAHSLFHAAAALPALDKRDVDSWVATELPIAKAQLLCNIGPDGCHSSGVSSGLVIASPSQSNPDCKSLQPGVPQ